MVDLTDLQSQLSSTDQRIDELNKQINFWSRWDREPEIQSAITNYQNELQNLVARRNNIAGQIDTTNAQNAVAGTPYQGTFNSLDPSNITEGINALRNNIKFAKERSTQNVIDTMKSNKLMSGGQVADLSNINNPTNSYDINPTVNLANPYTGAVSNYTGTNYGSGFTVNNPTQNISNTLTTQANINNQQSSIQNKINQLNSMPEGSRPSDWQSQIQNLTNQLNSLKQRW